MRDEAPPSLPLSFLTVVLAAPSALPLASDGEILLFWQPRGRSVAVVRRPISSASSVLAAARVNEEGLEDVRSLSPSVGRVGCLVSHSTKKGRKEGV